MIYCHVALKTAKSPINSVLHVIHMPGNQLKNFKGRLLTGGLAVAVFWATGLSISLLLLGPLLKSSIGLVDENDIAFYLGTAGRVAFSDIPRTLVEKTNILAFGSGALVRPIYYVDRVLETALWNTDGAYWYGWRIFMFSVVVSTMAWIFVRYAGFLLGGALLVYSLSFSMWADIWARSSGVSEQFTSFGLAIFAIGTILFTDRWRDGHSLRTASILVSIGAFLAMGCKENMLFLLVPVALVLAVGLWHRRLDAISVVALVLALGVGAWVAASVGYYMLSGKGVDMYGNAPSLRTALSSRLMLRIYGVIAFGVAASAAFNLVVLKYYGEASSRAHRQVAARLLVGVLIVVSIVVSQQVVYSGQLPAQQRYDFPALLGLPAVIILFVVAMRQTARSLWPQARWVPFALKICVSAALIVYASLVTWRLPPAVAGNVQRNTAFDSSLIAVSRQAGVRPDWPIIVRSYNPWDYEIVQALGLWLIAKKVTNPRFLFHIVDPSEPRTPFESKELDGVLQAQSRDGFLERGYRPLAELGSQHGSQCFVIALRAPELFAAERSAPNPSPGLTCVELPMRIYLDKGILKVLTPY